MPTSLAISAPAADLSHALRRRGLADVLDTTKLTRALYSSDASVYRVVPLAVARPRSVEELLTVLEVARSLGMPVTTRGAGTSCAGNAVGPGLVVDVARHLNRIHQVDAEAQLAVVDPGVVQAALQREAAPYGLRFGPDPSTHTRCTIGGMIGNNACGPRALGFGKTADNVIALEVVTGSGERLTLDRRSPVDVDSSASLHALQSVVSAHLGTIRTEFGTFGRQVSGYSLEHLLPERKFDVTRFLAGTEGTLAVITKATVRLVADAPHKIMIALGYASMPEAADATPSLLDFTPTAIEGLDRRIVEVVRRTRGEGAVPPLPRGDGWVFVELVGDDPGELSARAAAVLAASGCLDGEVVADPAQALALWKIREDGAGLAGVSLADPAYPGWEDAAVPPAKLGSYLRDFDALLDSYGLHGLPYGHFGDGCVHVRIDFPLTSDGGAARYRSFVEDAAQLVAGYGGSMSGEHGDGRARSALLPAMYSPAAISLFGEVKAAFDPDNLLNPGVLVDPRPVDADLRVAALVGRPADRFSAEVHKCSGVGKCLADSTGSLGVMCPSYQATRDEKDSTRGRARVLQEMINGDLVQLGWKSPAVHSALDLCLSCKGCARDCPTGIDMAAYKSEVLDHTYAGKLRPRSHYALGWLPRWGRLITRSRLLASVVNLTTATPGLRRIVRWSAGVDQRRKLPRFASRPARERVVIGSDAAGNAGKPVLVWVDSFSDCFTGGGVEAVVDVLRSAGYAPQFLDRTACCGLTWISTGQREGARRQLRQSLDVLHPYVVAGVPIVGLEPSCTAVWRSDAPELLPDEPRVAEVAAGVLTLAELLARTPNWSPPDLSAIEIVAQPHCHHAAVLGWQADAQLLKKSGATVTTLGGCCGLAGNFGVEKGHYDVSVKVAEHDLLPAVEAHPNAVVLADGFSCRTQLAELAGTTAITLAELLRPGTLFRRRASSRRPPSLRPDSEGPTGFRVTAINRVDARSTDSYGLRVVDGQRPVEIACDESGFTGGNLTFRHTVFTHASLSLPIESAREEMGRLRLRVAAHGELKASWLLRWCDDDDLHRLLDPSGLLGDQVRVHVTDTRLFLLYRLADVLLTSGEISGLDLPGEDADVREAALELYRQGDAIFGLQRWQDFLIAAGKALRATSRWVPASAVSDFEGVLGLLAAEPAAAPVRSVLMRFRAGAGRARAVRASLDVDSRRPPLLEPLLPALTRCVLRWGAEHHALVVVHDEQSVLTPWRVKDIARRLESAQPGHVLDLRRVDSRDDPRVQIADLVAGIARRAAASLLMGRPDRRLIDLITPVVDPRSVWPDPTWRDGVSPLRRPAWPRGGTDQPCARPA